MFAATAVLLAAPLLATASGPLEPGARLHYRGTVSPRVVDAGQPSAQQKEFELTWFVGQVSEAGAVLYWLADERGRGGWPWPERFGQFKLDSQGRPEGKQRPSLLYDYGEGESIVPLPSPVVPIEKPLSAGATWSAAGEDFEVQQEQRVENRDCWQLQVRNAYGFKRTMLVDKAAPLLVATTERVFMNQGTEYSLQMQLTGIDLQTDEQQSATAAAFTGLLALRTKLNRPEQSAEVDWNSEQIAILSAAMPELEKIAADGPLERLAAAAGRDAKLQSGRANEIAAIVTKFQGRPLPEFALPGLSGGTLSTADLAGQVTVLHFWEYRDHPLKEPYGQVGYLEFLFQKRAPDGVKVYGIAVDGRLNDPNERRAALPGIRKLKSFMNLTYPLALDGGDAIKSLGDPRIVGASLPLFLVVGRDGSIAHYHVGNYEVDRQNGLKELNAAVSAALKR